MISKRSLENALLTEQIERQGLFYTVTSRLLHDVAKIHATLARLYNVLENWRRRFQQFSSHITTVSGCYRELSAAWWFLFNTYNSGFPCVFVCLSFMLMAVDFSHTQKSYSVHVFNLYYIVIEVDYSQ